jgi:GntR family transcriptional regulator
MNFQIHLTSDVPIYQQLGQQIRAGVATGRLSHGQQLPSVREMSRLLVVNPNTIAKAYTELERDGVLHTRKGVGVFIAAPSSELTKTARKKRLQEKVDDLLTEAVYLNYPLGELKDLIETRAKEYLWSP